MDLAQQLKEQLDQYRAQGLDMATAQSIFQATYGDTTPLGLKRWKADNKPQMADFNRDNEILDREIRALREELEKKASEENRGKWEAVLKSGEEIIVPETAVAYYLKTKNKCEVWFETGITPVPTDKGTVTISGLPYPPANLTAGTCTVGIPRIVHSDNGRIISLGISGGGTNLNYIRLHLSYLI